LEKGGRQMGGKGVRISEEGRVKMKRSRWEVRCGMMENRG
jgi:hypothetical protein